MTGVLNQVQVEQAIMRISEEMEVAVEDLAKRAVESGEAEVDYRVGYSQQLLLASNLPGSGRNGKMTEGDKEATATIAVEHLLRTRLITSAYHEAAQEKLRAMRSRLDSLRTVSANLRAVTT